MDALVEVMLALAISVAMCAVAYRKGLFTPSGAVAAVVTAVAICAFSTIWWTLAYLAFPSIAFVATLFKIKTKEEKGLQEGKKGERSAMNILGVGIIPLAISCAYYVDGSSSFELTVAFLSALSVSLADTVSSEVGVMDDNVWMVTTLKRTEPGINGGVSRLGIVSSLIMSLAFALIVWVIVFHDFDIRFLIPAACGMLGNILDSIMGAVFENKGYISKYTNNASTSLFGGIVGFLLAFLF